MSIEAGGEGFHESSRRGPKFHTNEEVLHYAYTRLTGYLDIVGEKPLQGPPTRESIEDLRDHVCSIGANPDLVIGPMTFLMNVPNKLLTSEEMDLGRELHKKLFGADIFDFKSIGESNPESKDPSS